MWLFGIESSGGLPPLVVGRTAGVMEFWRGSGGLIMKVLLSLRLMVLILVWLLFRALQSLKVLVVAF